MIFKKKSLLKEERARLLKLFEDPSQDSTAFQTELELYVSLLHGFLIDMSENTVGDSKLRFSVKFKWSQSLGLQFIQ